MNLAAKAHDCRAQLMKSSAATLRLVAEEAGVTFSYFTRLVRFTYLTLDITRAFVQGNQPPTLTARLLTNSSRLPLDWGEQRTLLGFG